MLKCRKPGHENVWYRLLAAGIFSATAATATAAATAAAAAAATATAATAATAAIAAKAIPAAAEQNDQDKDNPQTTATAKTAETIITTHRQDPPIQVGDRNADLSPYYAIGKGLCFGSGIKKDYFGVLPLIVIVGLQQISSMSDIVAAGILRAASQSAQKSSTEL